MSRTTQNGSISYAAGRLIAIGVMASGGLAMTVTGDNVKEILRRHVALEARIMTDESAMYHGVDKEFAEHQAVNHKAGKYVRGDAHINTSESVHSLMKRGVVGVYHHWSVQHLHRYCSEFDFRFNRRKIKDGERLIEAIKSVEGKRLYYKDPLRKLKAEESLNSETEG